MPTKTYLAKKESSQPGYKVAKDRLTLLFGGNATGDCKLKPLLIYRSLNPRAFKGFSQHALPVFWRSNKKAWMTKTMFEDWFKNCFLPDVEKYLKSVNLDFKVLLILDNAPGHPTALGDLCDKVKIIFLPPNTSQIQPMDQGVIATFKAYYLRRTFSQAIEKTAGDNAQITLTQFWKEFNIKNAVENIGHAWNEVTISNLRSVWKHIIPHCANNFEGFQHEIVQNEIVQNEIVQEINDIGLNLGFEELDNGSIQELLQSHDAEQTNEDLDEVEQQRAFEEPGDNEETQVTREFTVKELDEYFRLLENANDYLMTVDPDCERAINVSRTIQNDIKCYKLMYDEKTKRSKQTSLLDYFKKK